jgi:hypothetical protein
MRPPAGRGPRQWRVRGELGLSRQIPLCLIQPILELALNRTNVQFKPCPSSSILGLLCRALNFHSTRERHGGLHSRESLCGIADTCEAAMSARVGLLLPAAVTLLTASTQLSRRPGEPNNVIKGRFPERPPDAWDVFVSYCERDQPYWERIETHLTPMRRAGVKIYSYDMVEPGAVIREDARSALLTSVVAVLGARVLPLNRLRGPKQDDVYVELVGAIRKRLIECNRYPKPLTGTPEGT